MKSSRPKYNAAIASTKAMSTSDLEPEAAFEFAKV